MTEEASGKMRFVTIRTKTLEHLRDLQRVWDLDVFRHTAKGLPGGLFEIQGLVSDEQIERLRAIGHEVVILSDADELAKERLGDFGRGDAAK